MNKKEKYFLAMSLGLSISCQNTMFISNANEINSSSDMPIYSTNDDNYNIKINSSKKQLDPKKYRTYNMGGSSSKNYKANENVSSIEIVNLNNPNAIGSGIVTSTTLNVRSGPSTSHDIIGILNINESVEILSKSNNWFKIDFNGNQGYIHSSNLKLNAIEKGIDVSKWNGDIDWKSVKNSGIDYVIIRAGYGTSTVDPLFKSHIEGAKDAGLKIGVYWFSYATSPEKALIEAQKCLETISPYKNSITYPVFFDFEYDSVKYAQNNGVTITKDIATNMANNFMNTVKSYGYDTGLYTNKDFSSTYYTDDIINSSTLWIAQYSDTNTFGRPHSMWQYSEKGSVPGINGAVDLNYTLLKTSNINSNIDVDIENPSKPNNDNEKGITTANVNFRNNASTSSSIISTIPKNTPINIIDKSISGWYKIEYKGVTGFVSSQYVSLGNNDSQNDTDDNEDDNKPAIPAQKGVTTANVNFRNNASTSSSIISTIPKNTPINIIDKSISGWYKIEYKGVTGFVSSQYVSLGNNDSQNDTDDNVDDNKPAIPTQKGITTANLNLRKSTSTTSDILATIPKNTSINIIDKSISGWYKIEYKGVTGFVSSQYVSLGNNDSQNDTDDNVDDNKPAIPTQKGITTANLNLRKSTSTTSNILATIPKNTAIQITKNLDNNWYQVKYKGLIGYVSSQYVKIK